MIVGILSALVIVCAAIAIYLYAYSGGGKNNNGGIPHLGNGNAPTHHNQMYNANAKVGSTNEDFGIGNYEVVPGAGAGAPSAASSPAAPAAPATRAHVQGGTTYTIPMEAAAPNGNATTVVGQIQKQWRPVRFNRKVHE